MASKTKRRATMVEVDGQQGSLTFTPAPVLGEKEIVIGGETYTVKQILPLNCVNIPPGMDSVSCGESEPFPLEYEVSVTDPTSEKITEKSEPIRQELVESPPESQPDDKNDSPNSQRKDSAMKKWAKRLGVAALVLSSLASVLSFASQAEPRKWAAQFSEWRAAPPSDASPLALQLADMLEDTDKWDLNVQGEITMVKNRLCVYNTCDSSGAGSKVRFWCEVDDLLTDSERGWLGKKARVLRERIVARHKANMARQLKGEF